MLSWFEHSQVYHPDRLMAATGAELGRPFEDVHFQAADGVALHGWFFPALADSPRARLAMLVCHGNAGNISHWLEVASALLRLGLNVFMFDYRGYGRSQGRPTEAGTYLDAQAAYQWLRAKGFSPAQIIAFGQSLGGAIATELALREPLAGLILLATFASIPDIGAELFPWLPVRWLATIKYETCLKLPRLQIPVLVMHSRSDELVPFHHAEKNFAQANQPKLFWELTGSHNDPLSEPRHFTAGLEKFLQLRAAIQTEIPQE